MKRVLTSNCYFSCVINFVYRYCVDLGVVTPAQIQFLTKNVVENTAADKLKNMGAIAYDPIKKDVYVSDANQKVGSIFRLKTTGDSAYTIVEPIVASKFNIVVCVAVAAT